MILVDEAAISQAEYTPMAVRVAPDPVVVGSTTRAADGKVSTFALPGGLRTGISGLGVFYPDRQPTQRVGIVPDVYSAPTVDGLREGRDEVLEQAPFEILGPDADEEEIRALATTPATRPGPPSLAISGTRFKTAPGFPTTRLSVTTTSP